MFDAAGEESGHSWRTRCYECYRPIDRCFCHQIPTIANRTNVLILQHMKERFHPFNTARILKKALRNSSLVVDHIGGLSNALSDMHFTTESGLLYPGRDSLLLEEIPESERPKQLVVLDGTWHHTKTLFRDLPRLRELRKVRLAPTEPSRYGIRREPHVLFLSTLEATVAALRILEPETPGLEKLVAAFDAMVENQLAHPKSAESVRRKRRPRAPLNIPKVLRGDLSNTVVVYGETAPSEDGEFHGERLPVIWVAERLGSSERFERTIKPFRTPPASFFQHLQIPDDAFGSAISMEAFRRDWESFLGPTDTLVYYFSNCTDLLKTIGGAGCTSRSKIYLKSIQLHRGQKNGTLESLLAALDVSVDFAKYENRACKRLAGTIALTKYLNQCDLAPEPRTAH